MIKFGFKRWRISDKKRMAVVEAFHLQKWLTLESLTTQVRERMRHFWESRMQRFYSFLGMPMKARCPPGPEKERRLRPYKEYIARNGLGEEVCLFTINNI